MARPDLQALTQDDLASIANRGLVKRALKELDAGTLSADWQEDDDGTIIAAWSDDVCCTLPGGKTIEEATCDCPALEMCRHILRTVLAWQTRQEETGAGDVPANDEPWNPGDIRDEEIEAIVPKTTLTNAKRLWSQGVLAELLRSTKPSARFHAPGHTVRFPVPHDLRYTRCSCSDPAPCSHAVLAIWSFRRMASELTSGIVQEGALDTTINPDPLTNGLQCVAELLENGFASVGTAWRDAALRASRECSAENLVWPSEILEELAMEYERYSERDAVFSPGEALDRVGELLLRTDAILAGKAPVPQAFIRGLRTDKDTVLGAARFIGLGGVVTERRSSSKLTVFLQDSDTGSVVTVEREFKEDPELGEPKPYSQLGRSHAVKDASMWLLASGQLVTQGGKRKASGKLVIGRARAAVNPQNFSWEQLKSPVLIEDEAELSARLALLPPASFRPRSSAGDFHVCPVASLEDASFDTSSNAIVAWLRDPSGAVMRLLHPWTNRGRSGAEALLEALTGRETPVFVSGQVRNQGRGIEIRPAAVIVKNEKGARRMIMPWLDGTSQAATQYQDSSIHGDSLYDSRLGRYSIAREIATEILLSGTRRFRRHDSGRIARAIREVEESGYHRMAKILREIESTDDPRPAGVLVRILALERELGG